MSGVIGETRRTCEESQHVILAVVVVDGVLVSLGAVRDGDTWRVKLGTPDGIRDAGIPPQKNLVDCYTQIRRNWDGARLIVNDLLGCGNDGSPTGGEP